MSGAGGDMSSSPSRRAGRLSGHQSLFSPNTIERWWVQIPARLNRYSALLSVAWGDGVYLTAWPRVAMLLPLLALVFGLVEGASHWKFLAIWDVGMSYGPAVVFAQSLPLVITATLVGTLSANAGLMLVLGYALGDFLWAGAPWVYSYSTSPIAAFTHVRVPQLATYVLFFLLAVMPIVSTNYFLAGLYQRFPGNDRRTSALRTVAMALLQGLFLYEWSVIAPMVFHTLWSWSGSGSPVTIAFFHHVTAPWLIGAAAAGIIIRNWLTSRTQTEASSAKRIQRLAEAALEAVPEGRGFAQRHPWVRAVTTATLMTLLASGYLPSPLMAAEALCVVVAILLARAYLVPRLGVWAKWSESVAKIPQLLRLALVVYGVYVVTLWVAGPGIPSGVPGAFGPERFGLLSGVLLLLALLPDATGQSAMIERSEASGERATATGWTAGRITLGIAFLLLVLAPSTLHAQCADRWCCCNTKNIWCALAASGFMPFFGGLLGGDGGGTDVPNVDPSQSGDETQDDPCTT